VPTFVDRGVSRGQRDGSPTVVNLSFLDWMVPQQTKQITLGITLLVMLPSEAEEPSHDVNYIPPVMTGLITVPHALVHAPETNETYS
jgi:hypothetical protein